MRVFDYSDYRVYLIERINENRIYRGYRAQIAEAAGCKKSFISQVLNSSVHLTPDHAAGLTGFWKMEPSEANYFIDLVLYARSGSPSLRKIIKERLDKAKLQQTELSERLQWKTISDPLIQQTYFSSWYWSAIHIIVSVSKFSTTQSIAERLRLSISLVENTLKTLSNWKLIESTPQGWKVLENKIHLGRSASMNEMNHMNWRQRAIENLQKQDSSSLHYSLVFAISHKDYDELREMIMHFLEEAHKKIEPSPCEEIAAFTFDLFKP